MSTKQEQRKTIRDLERKVNIEQGVEKADIFPEVDISKVSISNQEEITYASIARALANRYDSIYYVNIINNHYVEYISSSEYRDLKVETSGDDFFADSCRNILRVVHPDDREFALMIHQKPYLLGELEKEPVISVRYRIMFEGTAHYYNGRFTMAGPNDRDHIIIGWANVDSQVQRELEFEATRSEGLLAKNINNALCSDYVKIYYVDLDDDSYMILESNDMADGSGLKVTNTGKYFFADTQRNILREVYEPDQAKFSVSFQKETLLGFLEEGSFSMNYRLRVGGKPVYHTLKVVYADNRTHLLIGVRNIDLQMKREAEYEKRLHSMSALVNTDSLTGVKSKTAFAQEEQMLDRAIADGEASFAIVVCDVNGLKQTNDTLGHKAGDQLLKDAAMLISDIFKRSPVFRIGGDEFAIVLKGRDYENRQRLMTYLKEKVRNNMVCGEVVVATGYADYDPSMDDRCERVFTRADDAMYADKRALKQEQ